MGASSAAAAAITFFLFCAVVIVPNPTNCSSIFTSSINPNFTASYLQFIDYSGGFLSSPNNSFQARISSTNPHPNSCYFVIIHVISNTIVWSANRNTPISTSAELHFSSDGLTLYNDTGHPIWSTPPQNLSSVSSMKLLDSGNLVLLDTTNNAVWESFDSPTDLIVAGQKLRLGESLVSSVSDTDLSEGSYRLVLGASDAMLQWGGIDYWKMSMGLTAFKNSNAAVEYMVMNSTGVYLIGDDDDNNNGGVIVIQMMFSEFNESSSGFRMVKLDPKGVFRVVKINKIDGLVQEFVGPADSCRIPSICKRFGVCTDGGSCQCPPGFHLGLNVSNGDCVPSNGSLSLPIPCNGSSSNGTVIKYLNLREDLDYFSNDFTDPVINNVSLSFCQDLCSRNCSCSAVFYGQRFGSCYVIADYLGSFRIKSYDANRLGYVKAVEVGNIQSGDSSEKKKSDFPILIVVLLPSLGVIVIALVATLLWWWCRRRSTRDEDMDYLVSVPGLPVRFDYKELAVATENFKTQIGSGGFGTVYKGTLLNGTDIAVKEITCLGPQGRREFLTEIAVIGKIHHVNLVRLKGFCVHRGQRFLVYEYMNRGSLDRSLFDSGGGSVLEWKERCEIALGAARGLAYLHIGCDHKIVHCDIKPENILLHGGSTAVKISDFGMSKLLTPKQSGWFTTMRGTRGYLAPEWLTNSAVSEKTDVYSYGMMLLEIISGKKNYSVQMEGHDRSGDGADEEKRWIYFPLFVLEMHEQGRYLEVVDPRLGDGVGVEDVEKMVRVALCCVQGEPSLRPTMSNVVGMLEGWLALGEPRIESLDFLRFYGPGKRGGDENDNGSMLCRQQSRTSSSSCTTTSYDSSSRMSSSQQVSLVQHNSV
ncbi:hypothetical protein ABFX02_12G039300 [Erythranthe guttata]